MSKRNLIELLKIFKEEDVYVTLLGDNIVSLLVHLVLHAAMFNMAHVSIVVILCGSASNTEI